MDITTYASIEPFNDNPQTCGYNLRVRRAIRRQPSEYSTATSRLQLGEYYLRRTVMATRDYWWQSNYLLGYNTATWSTLRTWIRVRGPIDHNTTNTVYYWTTALRTMTLFEPAHLLYTCRPFEYTFTSLALASAFTSFTLSFFLYFWFASYLITN